MSAFFRSPKLVFRQPTETERSVLLEWERGRITAPTACRQLKLAGPGRFGVLLALRRELAKTCKEIVLWHPSMLKRKERPC